MMVGREAGRQDLVPHVCVRGKLRLINKSRSSLGMEEPGKRRQERAQEEEFKSSLVKGPDILHDKMRIIGNFQPQLMPTAVQGINICRAEQCMHEIGTL